MGSSIYTPADKLAGLEQVIFDERDRKLEEARARRAEARQRVAGPWRLDYNEP